MIDLVPLNQFSDRHAKGWRMISGYPLLPGDYAVTMASPDEPIGRSNKSVAATSRNLARHEKNRSLPRDERLEEVEEENRQLREQRDRLMGFADAEAVQFAFKLTPVEAKVLALLLHRGVADYEQLIAITCVDGAIELESPEGAVRSHIKRMRKKLRTHGIDFETVYGFGFELDEASRNKARRMVDAWKEQFCA